VGCNIKIELSREDFRLAFEETQLFAVLHPLPVILMAALDANHAKTCQTFKTLKLLFQVCADLISANSRLVVTFAVTAVGTDATRTFGNFDKVVILEMQMQAVSETKLAVVHILAHLFGFTAGEADVVVEAIARSVKLVADVVDLTGRVKVRHCYPLTHRLCLGQEIQLWRSFSCRAASHSIGVTLVVLFYVNCKIFIIEASHF
jgi:hypothetical protein